MSNNNKKILDETISLIDSIIGYELDELTVERAVIGIFFTGVKLNNGSGGICFSPIKDIPEAVCCPSSARLMPQSGKLSGKSALELVDGIYSDSPLKKALGIATINALSSTCWKKLKNKDYKINIGKDPVDSIYIPDDAVVGVVGALVPYIKTLKKRGKPFYIFELDPTTLKPDEMKYYVPINNAKEKFKEADILIVTGTTLINDTLDDILLSTKKGAQVIVVGPTCSMLPDALFDRNVTAVGGVLVTKPDEMLDVLSEAGSGYHFFGKSAEKYSILNEKYNNG